LITSDAGEARAFIAQLMAEGAGVVYKQTMSIPDGPPTRLLVPEDLDRLESVTLSPVTFQERIEGGVDLRIAVIGDQVFAAEWRPDEETEPFVDVRFTRSARMYATRLDPPFEAQVIALQRELGLDIGIYDFKQGSDGRRYFLEVNPGGQWLDLEVDAGHPVSLAVARLLAGETAAGWSGLAPLTNEDLDGMMETAEAA
jgi:hypothetical protein